MYSRKLDWYAICGHLHGVALTQKTDLYLLNEYTNNSLLLSDDFYDRLYLHTLLVCQYIIICILLADLYLSVVYILLIYTSQQHLSLSIAS